MAGEGGKKCLEHRGASPKSGEVNMLDLFWVSDDESTELGGDEVDVSDRQRESLLDDDQSPFLFRELTQTSMDGCSH